MIQSFESLEVINKRLEDYFGKFETGLPNYRVVFSDDQREKRHGTFRKYTESGLYLGEVIETREVPKYGYIKSKFVLERLTGVPSGTDLIANTSYEPIWTFEDKFGNALPPKWEAIELIIETIHEQIYRATGNARYKETNDKFTKEALEERIKKMEEYLFGNETSVTDALAYDSAVGYGVRNRKDN